MGDLPTLAARHDNLVVEAQHGARMLTESSL